MKKVCFSETIFIVPILSYAVQLRAVFCATADQRLINRVRTLYVVVDVIRKCAHSLDISIVPYT